MALSAIYRSALVILFVKWKDLSGVIFCDTLLHREDRKCRPVSLWIKCAQHDFFFS